MRPLMETSAAERIRWTAPQLVELLPIEADDFIVDIGGGGEGIIGKLNGRQVIAIDPDEQELAGTRNEALKIVMDATDLKFLPGSFGVCTAFFSLMYVSKDKHLKVFEETHRVLRDQGRFLLWDAKIPDRSEEYRVFAVRLKVRTPSEEIETGYATGWDKTQSIEYFRQLAHVANFKIVDEWATGEIFYLEMQKES